MLNLITTSNLDININIINTTIEGKGWGTGFWGLLPMTPKHQNHEHNQHQTLAHSRQAASKQASMLVGKASWLAGRRASKQASMQASKHASKQAGKQASKQASKQTKKATNT